MKFSAALLFLSPLIANAEVIKLTSANYNELTDGKTVFIKFFAPWCGHCQALAPAWEQLAEEWKDHEVGLVAEVDCTEDDSEALCNDNQVQGYPTLMYGDPAGLESYEGGRNFDDLSAFAKENISKPTCTVTKMDFCDDAQKKVITELQSKSVEELTEIEEEVHSQLETAHETFQELAEKLNEQYQAAAKEFNEKVDEIYDSLNYKFVQQLLKQKDDGSDVKDEL